MSADIILFGYDDVHHLPSYDIASHLVYVTDEQDVINVIIDGKLVMHEKELLTIDTKEIEDEVLYFDDKIKKSIENN